MYFEDHILNGPVSKEIVGNNISLKIVFCFKQSENQLSILYDIETSVIKDSVTKEKQKFTNKYSSCIHGRGQGKYV